MAAYGEKPMAVDKRLHPHVLRHSCAMSLLQAGVDTTVIALWLGHADIRSTQPYLHADLTIKERALALVTPTAVSPGRYKPPDTMLAFPRSTVTMPTIQPARSSRTPPRAGRSPPRPTACRHSRGVGLDR